MSEPFNSQEPLDDFETYGCACTEQSATDFEEVLCRAACHHPGLNVHDPAAAIEMLNAAEDNRNPSRRHLAQRQDWCLEPTSGVRWHEGWAR